MKNERNIIGIMSGTSLDGIDAAMITVRGVGLDIEVTPMSHASSSLGEAADTLKALARDLPIPPSRWATTILEFSEQCARVALECANGIPADLIVVHGQTVHHAPPSSIQLINAAVLAQRTGCPVMHDLRAADLAAGGQGAPITPMADWILFRDTDPTSVVNLGGFCNFTYLPSSENGHHDIGAIQAGDICPCNHLLDEAARRLLGLKMDPEGGHAMKGKEDVEVSRRIVNHLTRHDGERSLGSGDEGNEVLDFLSSIENPDDALATLSHAIAGAIISGLPKTGHKMILAGGGAFNECLVESVRAQWEGEVVLSSELGIDIQAREAIGMAILGTLAQDGVPVTLPQVTGRNTQIACDGCLTTIAEKTDR